MATIVALITTAFAVLTAPPAPTAAVASPQASSGTAGSLPPRDLGKSSGPDSRERPALASWYVPRPSACWDALGRHPLLPGLVAYTAHPSLPCGTLVDVSGPAGTITVPVEDHGPEAWTGRALDLSPAAFRAVAGSLSAGVVPVTWRAAP
jgi:rare lipoprotein A (peptidoglycan hydrolase)